MPHRQTREKFRFAVTTDGLSLSGAHIVAMQYASYLAKAGYDVTLIVTGKTDPKTDAFDSPGIEGVDIVIFERFRPLKDLCELMDLFDVVIISNSVIAPLALEASQFTQKPLVVEIMNFFYKAGLSPAVDITVAVSRPVFDYMGPKENDFVFAPGVDVSLYTGGKRTQDGKVRLIQLATAGKFMDPDLADVARELIDEGLPIEAAIVGREGPSGNGIQYLGYQKYDRIPSLLKASDILLHMSRVEAFGLTAVEAMAAGVITVVSDTGGLPLSVLDGVTGCVVPAGDRAKAVSTVKNLVRRIIEGDPDIDAMRSRAIARAGEHFDIRKNMTDLGRLLEEKARTLPRRGRLKSYPFSFVSTAFYCDVAMGDAFLACIGDIGHVDDVHVESAFRNWQAFHAHIAPYLNEMTKALFALLGRIYSAWASDIRDQSDDRRAVDAFWLAMATLLVGKAERMTSFIGAANPKGEIPLTAAGAKRVYLAAIGIYRHLSGQDAPERLVELCRQVKNLFLARHYDAIEGLPLDEAMTTELIRNAGYGDFVRYLDGGVSS
jgi:glycosyltransferase involved in cell wall biosynthesis